MLTRDKKYRFWALYCVFGGLWVDVTIGTPTVIFAVLTVFWLFLVHCWYTVGIYSLGRHVTMVHQWSFLLFWLSLDCFWPLVYQSSQVYQDCTISVPIVKNSQKQSKDSKNSKNHRWCTNRRMSTQSPPNTQRPRPPLRPPNTQSLGFVVIFEIYF